MYLCLREKLLLMIKSFKHFYILFYICFIQFSEKCFVENRKYFALDVIKPNWFVWIVSVKLNEKQKKWFYKIVILKSFNYFKWILIFSPEMWDYDTNKATQKLNSFTINRKYFLVEITSILILLCSIQSWLWFSASLNKL